MKSTERNELRLAVSGTLSYTLKCGPSRMVWSGTHNFKPGEWRGEITLAGKKKPWWRWYPELIVWHCWRRWRKARVLGF